MIAGCLAAKANYLDITGEIDVIESAFAHHEQARAAGVTLLPAVGFDVVPTDCLAALLAQRLHGAVQLQLAFAFAGSMSRGTAKTMLESLPTGGRARIGSGGGGAFISGKTTTGFISVAPGSIVEASRTTAGPSSIILGAGIAGGVNVRTVARTGLGSGAGSSLTSTLGCSGAGDTGADATARIDSF